MEIETTSKIHEGYIEHQGIRLHYLANMSHSIHRQPLVFIPGFLGRAEHFQEEMMWFSDRPCFSLSLRGRGKSSVPATGYTLSDHASDIECLAQHFRLDKFIGMAHSVGVPYLLEFALSNPNAVSALLLLDYPARINRPTQDWESRIRQRIPDINETLLEGLVRETTSQELWDRLPSLKVPTLLIRGGTSESLCSQEMADRYRQKCSELEEVVLPSSGHVPSAEDQMLFRSKVESFVKQWGS
jgi:pimeloyl-ACP methyl ester carboxylesterase